VSQALKKSGDLFAPVLKLKQKLPAPFLALETKRRRARAERGAGRVAQDLSREARFQQNAGAAAAR
jgi:hypothetical protein